MKGNAIIQISVFIILLMTQILVLNHIHLFGFASPIIYIYLVVTFRRHSAKWASLIWSFCMGICVDISSNTPGVAAASMTFLGLIQPYFLELFMQRESPDDFMPNIRTMGFWKFLLYLIILVLTYCLLYFTLEMFSFFNLEVWGENICGCATLTILLILVVENLRRS